MSNVDRVVVLMLENRSFDHLLGLLDHPDPDFDGLRRGGPHTNPNWPGPGTTEAGPGAKYVVPVGPDHSHDAVMEQLAPVGRGAARRPTNEGFVLSYERKARGLAPPAYRGLLAPILNWRARRRSAADAVVGRGPLVMLAQTPDRVPVLAELARAFAVCTRWFCSVPGETWPNRNFVHAATSHGETDIEVQPYYDRTIFELLEAEGVSWHIYYDDTPQVWAFPKLWDTPERHAQWFEFSHFAGHVAAGSLPTYSFIEPNHRPPVHTLDHAPVVGRPDVSDSQHPENNLVTNGAYDDYVDGPDCDFVRAEALVAEVYETLRAHPEVFEGTLLLVTYDEHGGLYDHVPPPPTCPPKSLDPRSLAGRLVDGLLGGLTRVLRLVWTAKAKSFDFTLLGPRVPAVVISPYVPAARVDTEVRDHTSVPATLRALFAPGARALTARDRAATPFHTLLSEDQPRRGDALPDLSRYVRPASSAGPATEAPAAPKAPAAPPGLTVAPTGSAPPSPAGPPAAATGPNAGTAIPDYYRAFVAQADLVHAHLQRLGEPETSDDLPEDDWARSAEISRRFAAAAARHRAERSGRAPETPG